MFTILRQTKEKAEAERTHRLFALLKKNLSEKKENVHTFVKTVEKPELSKEVLL
jgi:pyrroloquinoline quinone (PQQ) biosynthesis protein C